MRATTATVLVIFTCLTFQACTRTTAYYVRAGNEQAKAGHLDDAVLSFRKAVQMDNKNAEAVLSLGTVLRRQGKYEEALIACAHASDLNPRLQEANIASAELATALFVVSGNKTTRLFDIIDKSVQRLEDINPDAYDTLRLKGQLEVLNKKYADAVDRLSKARVMKPEDQATSIPLVEALLGLGRNADAERVALQTIEKHKQFGEMYDALFQIYMQTGREQQAEALLLRKVSANPEKLRNRIQLAGFYAVDPLTRNKAEETLAPVVNDQRYPEAHLEAGNMYMRLNQRDAARRHFETGVSLKSGPTNRYRTALSALNWSEGRQEDAITLVSAAVAADPKDVEAHRLRGSYLLSRGKPADADTIIADYTLVLQGDPKNHIVNYQLGRAYQLKPDRQAALKYLQTADKVPGYLAPKLALAEINAQSGRFAETLRYLDEILEIDNENVEVRVLRAVALRSLNREADARAELQRILRVRPGAEKAELELAVLDLLTGRPEKATAVFQRWYNSGPNDPKAAVVLAESLIAQKQYLKAFEVIKKEAEIRSSDPDLRFAAAETAERGGDLSRAIGEMEQLTHIAPRNSNAFVKLGQLRIRAGQQDAGLQDLRTAANLASDNSMVQLAFATALHMAGRTSEAAPVYIKALNMDRGNAAAANNLAYLYAGQKMNLDEALRLAQLAVQKQPDNASYADTLASVYSAKSMYGTAVQVMRTVVKKNPQSTNYRLQLARLLISGGKPQDAGIELAAVSKAGLNQTQQLELNQLLTAVR